MKTFKKVKIRNVTEINPNSIGRDFGYQTIKYIDISSVGVGNLSDAQEINRQDAPSRAKRLVKSGDTIISTVRPNRRSFFFFNNPEKNIVVSTGFAVLRPLKNTNPRYLYYSVTNKSFTDYLTKNAKGSAYPAVDADIIYDGEITIPEKIEDQSRIASVLSAYDDLIENNAKRIKALEEMVQLLYTEWFVLFKFPGHEKAKMVDSRTEYGMVPEGWEVKTFEDSFDIQYGKNLPTTRISESGKYEVYGAGGIIGFYDQKNVDTKTALVTCRGNGSGTVWRTFGGGFITNNSFTVKGKNKDVTFEFIYNCLKECNISAAISGSAQPQITIESINFVKFILAPINLIIDFMNQTRKSYELSDDLLQKNQDLSKMRDLLIPQLVTGKRIVK